MCVKNRILIFIWKLPKSKNRPWQCNNFNKITPEIGAVRLCLEKNFIEIWQQNNFIILPKKTWHPLCTQGVSHKQNTTIGKKRFDREIPINRMIVTGICYKANWYITTVVGIRHSVLSVVKNDTNLNFCEKFRDLAYSTDKFRNKQTKNCYKKLPQSRKLT